MNNHISYLNGNRVKVPSDLGSRHFLYHAQVAPVSSDDISILVDEAMGYLRQFPLSPADITAIGPYEFKSKKSYDACERIAMRLGISEDEANQCQILACEWAAIHCDSSFAGKAFLSLVLHTGTHPYVMQTADTEIREYTEEGSVLEVRTTTKTLERGDVIIFDPTTPHFAVPSYPHDDQVLILLQFELDDQDSASREDVLTRYPVANSKRPCEIPDA